MYISCTQNVWLRCSLVRHEHAYSRRCRSHARRCYDSPLMAESHSNNGRVIVSGLSTHVHVLPGQRLEAADNTRQQTRHDRRYDKAADKTLHLTLAPPPYHHFEDICVGGCMSKYAHTHPQRYLRKHDRVVGGKRKGTYVIWQNP